MTEGDMGDEPRGVAAGEDVPGFPRHVVRRGENFFTIAQRYYGSGRYYQALWAANRGDVPTSDHLAVGMAIAVPPLEDLDPALVIPAGRPAEPSPPKRDDRVRRA